MKNKIVQVDENWKDINGKYVCPLCYKNFSKYGISNHIMKKHFNIKYPNQICNSGPALHSICRHVA